MDIKLKGRELQTQEAKPRWLEWYEQHTKLGMTIDEIASKSKNPKTGKPYSRSGVYFGINRLKVL